MAIETSYENWGGSGDRRDIIESNYPNLFDGDKDTSALSVNRNSQRELILKFKGVKAYIDELMLYGHEWMSIDVEKVYLNGASVQCSFSVSTKRLIFNNQLEVSTGDELKIMLQHQHMNPGGGTAPATFNEIEFKIRLFHIKTLILSNNQYQKYTENGWESVSSILPNQAGFEEHGMDSLENLDRTVQLAGVRPMINDGTLGEGKLFRGTVDLKKYFDLRKIEVK